MTEDYGATYTPIRFFDFNNSMIETGAECNEFFVYDDTKNIFYSFDGCTTFNEINYFGDDLITDTLSLLENTFFVRGWTSMEILCYQFYEYPGIPSLRASPGGIVEIFISKDCGATWNLVSQHDVRGTTSIRETNIINNKNELCVAQSSS
jgi:hypothetical protein